MPAQTAFAHYQSIRHRLPLSMPPAHPPILVKGLLEMAEDFDSFFFDAFGVLNVGHEAIPGAPEVVAELQRQGKNCFVVSNAAGFEKSFYVRKYAKFGYQFAPENIVTSRDALLGSLSHYADDFCWGVIGSEQYQDDLTYLGLNLVDQDTPDFYDRAEGFLFLSPLRWDDARQEAFKQALRDRPRPVLLGNPDLIAPMGDHTSIEAGTYALMLEDELFPNVQVFGKPFPAIYEIAAGRLLVNGVTMDPTRTLMLGDTLHTDILGGSTFGIQTALVTGHGFFKELDHLAAIKESGIVPNFILPGI